MKNIIFISINGDGNLININKDKSSKKKWLEKIFPKFLKLIWKIVIGIVIKIFIIIFDQINLLL